MKVRALANFGTARLSFIVGQEADITDEALANELVRAKFVEPVEKAPAKPATEKKPAGKAKAVAKDEGKRDND